jgi:hypothetical protein
VLLADAVTFVTELSHRRAQVTSAYALRVFQTWAAEITVFFYAEQAKRASG